MDMGAGGMMQMQDPHRPMSLPNYGQQQQQQQSGQQQGDSTQQQHQMQQPWGW